MRQKLLSDAAEYLVKNRRRRMWAKAVSCMAAVVVFCTTYVLILPALTMEKETVCEYVEHIHTEECYQEGSNDVSDGNNTQAVSDGDVSDGDEGTYCGLHAHTHTTECFGDTDPTADVETEEEWKASFANVNLTGNWAQNVVAIAQSQVGYTESEDNYFYNTETKKLNGYTRYGAWYGDEYGDWNTMFVAFCLNYAQVTGYPVDMDCAEWVEILSQEDCNLYREAGEYTPVAGDLIFFDTAKNDGKANSVGIVEEVITSENSAAQLTVIVGDTEDQVKRVSYKANDASILGYGELPTLLTAEEQEQVNFVISLIDEVPSADEIDAKIEEFEDAEDYEGEEAWLTEVYQQVARAYYYYNLLTEEQKLWVTNADKLLELEYIWSMTTYQYMDSLPIYQVNSYKNSGNASEAGILLYGNYVSSVIGTSSTFTNNWYAYVIKWNTSGYWYLDKYYAPGTSKSGIDAGTDGFVILANSYDDAHSSSGYLDSIDSFNSGTKIYVTVNFDFADITTGAYKSAGYGNVTFGTSAAEGVMKKTSEESDPPTVVKSASTSNFIELNLYNYGSNINELHDKYDTESFTNQNGNTRYSSKYPGFQWNGGAYLYSTTTSGYADRNSVDNIDFGNSLITDFKYGSSSSGSYGKSSNAQDIVAFGDYKYNINALDFYYNGTNKYGINNRPIGMSLNTNISNKRYDTLQRTLGTDGYPALKDGTSLGYLFGAKVNETTYATKQNTVSIDGLFQYEELTGGYWYNSRWNHAQYSNNKFTLYDEIITPNLIVYPFGNFLPFNDITDTESATQVSKITSMGNYIQYFMNQLWSYYNAKSYNGVSVEKDATKAQLYYMLYQYKQNVNYYNIHGTTWSKFDAEDAIWDYLTNGGNSGGPTDEDSYPITDEYLKELYNIDFDVEKDFFFGMDMKMEFYMPKDGWVGKDNGDNSQPLDANHIRPGEPDGLPDQPMIFSFTGDDDVWIYVDDVLFLDLSGIHRHVGGRINYTEGKVYYYYLDVESGDIDTENPYATYTFAQILEAAGKEPADYLRTDASGNYTTFKDYSTHTFKFYYMERGSGSSICSINFNFPLVEHNSITVSKELTDDSADIEALGNPDFTFQVLDADDNTNFLRSNQAYSLYDTDGSVIQEVHVTEENQDGSIKTIQIKDKDGNVICTESYDSNNNVTYTGSNQDSVLRIKDDGTFTLKAGQTATFVGINQDAGQYYVREILREDLKAQYGTISITGSASKVIDPSKGLSETDIENFVGADSPAQYATNSHIFHYENKISTANLGKLSITKNVDAAYSGSSNSDKEFEFNITLDGELLPENLDYKVVYSKDDETVEETRQIYYVYVDQDGKEYLNPADKTGLTAYSRIVLKHGETATISNIIAGSAFEITEVNAADYTVSYTVVKGEQKTTSTTKATGTVGTASTVQVNIINSEIGTSVDIPVWKNMAKNDDVERNYTFVLQKVADKTGTPLEGDTASKDQEITISPGSEDKGNKFILSYLPGDITGTSGTFYYKISEVAGTNTEIVYDTTYYVIEVTVTRDGTEMSAEITGAWKNGNGDNLSEAFKTINSDISKTPIVFNNVIVRNITLSKTVVGSVINENDTYRFTVSLDVKDSGVEIPTTISGMLTNGEASKEVSYTVTKSQFTVELKNGETVVLKNIPFGMEYTITEETTDGFMVTYDTGSGAQSGDSVSGIVADKDITVDFTNTLNMQYELPQTGGIGTTSYTMAGLILLLSSVAYLMYIRAKKRKEVS